MNRKRLNGVFGVLISGFWIEEVQIWKRIEFQFDFAIWCLDLLLMFESRDPFETRIWTCCFPFFLFPPSLQNLSSLSAL